MEKLNDILDFICILLQHPTSSSWLNMVERWFRDITDKRLCRGTFKSVPSLIKAINEYIKNHNQNPKTFIWSASAEQIMENCFSVNSLVHV
jgi:hypothetical protein